MPTGPEASQDASAEILRSLELPPEAVPLFLAHIQSFCRAHGGEKHYAELLDLVARYSKALEGGDAV